MQSSAELFMRWRGGYFGVYFPICAATRETNTIITTRMSTKMVRYKSTYIIKFLIPHNESTNHDKKWWSPHIDPTSHSPGLHSADDVSRNLITSHWPDNFDTIMPIVIFNSLDVVLFHSNIHGWSLKSTFLLEDYILRNTDTYLRG